MARQARLQKSTLRPVQPAAVEQPTSRTDQPLLTKLLYSLFLLTLLTPLLFSAHVFFGFISVRALYFRALVLLMVGLAIWYRQFLSAPLTLLQKVWLIWLGWMIVTASTGIDPVNSFLASFLRMEGVVGYTYLGLYFAVLARVPFGQRRWQIAWLVVIAVALLVFVSSYGTTWGWQTDRFRLVGTVGNPSYLAVYWLIILFLLGFVAGLTASIDRRIRVGAAIVIVALLGWGIVLTGTRSAFVGLGAGCLVLSVGLVRLYRHQRRMWVFGGILTLVLGVGLFWFIRQGSSFGGNSALNRLSNFRASNNTATPRLINWKMALRGIAERPIVGWGQENYGYGFMHYYDANLLERDGSEWYDRTHNLLLEWAFGTGIPGLLIVLTLLGVMVRNILSNTTNLPISRFFLLAALAGYLAFNLLNPDNLLAIQLVVLVMAVTDVPAITDAKSTRWAWAFRAGLIALLLGLGWLWVDVWQSVRSLKKQETAPDTPTRLSIITDTYRQATVGKYELADVVLAYALSVLPSAGTDAQKAIVYEPAAAIMTDQQQIRPGLSRVFTRSAQLNTAANHIDLAITDLRRAVELEEGKRPTTLLTLGEAYLRQRDPARADNVFQLASRIRPDWPVPRIEQALTRASQRDTSGCRAILRQLDTPSLVKYRDFIRQVYASANDLPGYVQRIRSVPYNERQWFTKELYQDWALTAYELGRTDGSNQDDLETALVSFYLHFKVYKLFSKDDVLQVANEARRGQRPDRMQVWLDQLPKTSETGVD